MEFGLRLAGVRLHLNVVQNTGFQALGCRWATFKYYMNMNRTTLTTLFLYTLYLHDSRPEFSVPRPLLFRGQCALVHTGAIGCARACKRY